MKKNNPASGDTNHLFPVFLKLENLKVLIIGGGNVALEKLNAIIQNAPATPIRIVAKQVSNPIKKIAASHPNIELTKKPYQLSDIKDADLIISAVNDWQTSELIRKDAKRKGKLINVADKPELCDFYLGSIVQKGNLKIAISTNGKSPTIAKRLKQVLSEAIPDEINDLLENINSIRQNLEGDFAHKVHVLNSITEVLVSKKEKTLPKRRKTGNKTLS